MAALRTVPDRLRALHARARRLAPRSEQLILVDVAPRVLDVCREPLGDLAHVRYVRRCHDLRPVPRRHHRAAHG